MDAAAIDITKRTVELTILLCLPVLGTALVVGLIVSILQAVTQINEMTLTFVPKILIVGVVTLALAPWMISLLGEFTEDVIKLMGEAPRGGGF